MLRAEILHSSQRWVKLLAVQRSRRNAPCDQYPTIGAASLPDCSARDSLTGIACRLRFVVVRICVDHDATSDNSIRTAAQVQHSNFCLEIRFSTRIGDEVRQITCVTIASPVVSVRFTSRIEMAFRTRSIGSAAIAGFVDVETMLTRSQSGDIGFDTKFLSDLRESDGACDRTTGTRFEFGHSTRLIRGCRRGASNGKKRNDGHGRRS